MLRPAEAAATPGFASSPEGSRTEYDVDLLRRLGPLTLELKFTLAAAWTVLFAPSGAGKSSVLRMIAGLDRPDQGRVLGRFSGPGQPQRELLLTDTRSKIFVPTHQRGIRMVAQRPALFPHLSVLRNVRYRASGVRREEKDHSELAPTLGEIFHLCRITHLRDKMPSHLSGGEAQRVALARALSASGGNLLLLDEPFTGLESELREEIIRELRPYLASRGIPVLQVTHDLGEVFSAGAEVVRMEGGRIVAQGPAEVVLARERQALLARLQR